MNAEDFFRKDVKPMLGYRLNDSIFSECANANAAVDLQDICNLVYSQYSLAELMKRRDSAMYLSEALIKSYPTDKFTQLVSKTLLKTLQLKTLLVGQLLSDNYCLVTSDRFQICRQLKQFPSSNNAYMRMHYNQIADSVAGKVTYELLVAASLFSSFDSFKQTLQHSLAKLIADARRCGYSFVAKLAYADKMTYRYELHFEAVYPKQKFELPSIAWHITSKYNSQNILRKGLKPVSKSSLGSVKLEHPDRVYMFTEFNPDMFQSFACQKNIDRPVAVEISIALANLKALYADPMYEMPSDGIPIAIYTYEQIQPNAIVKITEMS